MACMHCRRNKAHLRCSGSYDMNKPWPCPDCSPTTGTGRSQEEEDYVSSGGATRGTLGKRSSRRTSAAQAGDTDTSGSEDSQ